MSRTLYYRLAKASLLLLVILGCTAARAATYYWDSNDATAGFGTAGGTWAAPTVGTATGGWSTDASGATVVTATSVTVATSDAENFGTASLGLGSGTITVSGSVASGNMTFGAASGAITLSGGSIGIGNSTITVHNTIDTISSTLTGSNGLTKSGAGALALTGLNTRTGALTISQGTLSINTIKDYSQNSSFGAAASGSVILGGGANTATLSYTGGASDSNRTFQVGDGTAANAGGAIINNDGTGALTFDGASFNTTITGITATRTLTLGGTYAGGTNEIQGVIRDNVASTGKINLVMNGSGTWKLSGANTYTGTTTVSGGTLILSGATTGSGAVTVSNGGTLTLDYTNNTSRITDGTALTLGGNLNLSGGSHTEIVASTTLTANTYSSVNQPSGTSVLEMNGIVRNTGATINFGEENIATTTNGNDATGILGQWATVGGTDLAAVSSGSIVAYTGYTDVPRLTPGTIAAGANSNVRIVEGSGSAGNITMAASGVTAINTLLQSVSGGTSAATVDVGTGNTLRAKSIVAATGSGAMTLGVSGSAGTLTAATSGGELILNNLSSNVMTVNSVIANNSTASSLVISGNGTVNLAGTNTHTGGTIIAGGTLQIANTSALGSATSGALTMGGGVLDLNGNNLSVGNFNGTAGTVVNNVSGTRTLTIGGGNGTGTFAGVIANNNNAGSGVVALNKTGSGAITLSGNNSFSGGLTVNGASGTLTLTGNNTFSGGITLTAGTLATTSDANLGNSAGITFNGNATWNLGSSVTVTYNRSLTIDNTGVANFSSGNAAKTITGVVSGNGSLVWNVTTDLILSNPSNTFNGPLTVTTGGTNPYGLSLYSIGDATGAGQFNLGGAASTGYFYWYGGAKTFDDRQFALAGTTGGGVIDNRGTGALSISKALLVTGVGNKTLTLGGTLTAANNIFSGKIADGTGSVVTLSKTGASTWTLSGDNSFSGGLTLSGATVGSQLNINSATALGTGTFTISGGNNAKIDNTSGNAITLSTNNPMTWTNDFAFVGSDDLNLGTGAVTMGGNRNITVSGGTLTVGGVISGTTFGITKSGLSTTLVLNGLNDFTGNLNIGQGAVSVNTIKDYGLPSSVGAAPSGDLLIGTANTSTLIYTGGGNSTNRTVKIGSGTASSTAGATIRNDGGGALVFTAPNFNSSNGAITAARVLTLRGANTDNNEIQGIISNGTTSTGTINLAKADIGTWTLSGANTYTGTTSITGGALFVNSTHGSAATPVDNYTVTGGANAATLAGDGTIFLASGKTITVSGTTASGFIDPGGPEAINSLTVAATDSAAGVVFGANSTFQVDFTGGSINSDQLRVVAAANTANVGGTLDLSSVSDTLNLVGTGTGSGSYTIATFATLTGTFNNVLINGLATQNSNPLADNYADVNYNANSITVDIANAAVPEPTSLTLLALGAIGCLARRPRKNCP